MTPESIQKRLEEHPITVAVPAFLCLRPGTKVRFAEERQSYTVRAIGNRYAVCTKPMNARKTVLYTVIDFLECVRGTESLVFCMGAETDQDCREMLQRLERPDEWYGKPGHWPTEVSHRNRVPLKITHISND